MTNLNRKLLTSVYNAQETREAILGGCRIIDCEDPRSALGNIKPREIMDISDAALDFARGLDLQVSTNIGEDQLLFDRAEDGRAIEKSPYEIAGKAAQAAIGVAVAMGTRLHPVHIVKVGLDGMELGALAEVLMEVVYTLDRTEDYAHAQVMSVLFVQDIGTWKKRRSNKDVIKQLVEVREFQPAAENSEGSVNLIEFARGVLDRNGVPYFRPDEEITLGKLIEKKLLPPGVPTPTIRLNDPFPHSTFFPDLAGGPDERTNKAVIKAMVDATADAGAKSIMLDTSILSKVARICLVDTAESDTSQGMVDLNRFDAASNGLTTQGILPFELLKFFVDYCHYRGVAMNFAGSVQSFQSQQLWVLIPEIDQISARGAASALNENPFTGGTAEDTRHAKVIKRHMVRGGAAPEHGGVLNIPESWSNNSEAMASVREAAKMIADKRKSMCLPDLECYFVDKFGNPKLFNPL
jgi:uncharacterized protein (UPF0264 family)